MAAFLLFSLVFGWSPVHGRLHLPLFILAATPVGMTLAQALGRWGKRVPGLLLLTAAPWVLAMNSRPVLEVQPFTRGNTSILTTDRITQYFVTKREREPEYRQAAAVLHGLPCREVGIVSGSDSWEYPLWVLLKSLDRTFRIVHADPLFTVGSGTRTTACARVYIGPGLERMRLNDGERELYRGSVVVVVGSSR